MAAGATNACGVGQDLPDAREAGVASALEIVPVERVGEADGRDAFEKMFGFGLAPAAAGGRDHLVDLAGGQFSRDIPPPGRTQCLRIVRPSRPSSMLVAEVVGAPAWRGRMVQVRVCQHCGRGDVWTRLCFWGIHASVADRILELRSGDRIAVGGGEWVDRNRRFGLDASPAPPVVSDAEWHCMPGWTWEMAPADVLCEEACHFAARHGAASPWHLLERALIERPLSKCVVRSNVSWAPVASETVGLRIGRGGSSRCKSQGMGHGSCR